MRLKRYMQGIGFVYVLLLLGLMYPKDMTQRQEVEAPKEICQEASAYVAESMQEHPKIAITFDDGPSAAHTPKLLDGLKERGVKATFFLLGKNIDKGENKDIVKRMYEEGHLIGNHTYSHVEITKISDEETYEEIAKTNALIESITGEKVEFMRPPFGSWKRNLEKNVGVIPVLWNIDPLDWATENEDEIVNKVVTEAGENDIILLHDCYDSTVNAALRIIDLLQAEGYRFVTVDELLMD